MSRLRGARIPAVGPFRPRFAVFAEDGTCLKHSIDKLPTV
jgi:hypothetical protein